MVTGQPGSAKPRASSTAIRASSAVSTILSGSPGARRATTGAEFMKSNTGRRPAGLATSLDAPPPPVATKAVAIAIAMATAPSRRALRSDDKALTQPEIGVLESFDAETGAIQDIVSLREDGVSGGE